jgi:hypothetical protein
MKTITYNSAVAKRYGANGIIKAVLLNYIYNYHKLNPRKTAGHPACISLEEFVYQYQSGDKSLWKRSFIHRILQDLVKEGHLSKTREGNSPVYTVSPEIAALLTDPNPKAVSFDLAMACEYGINIAIVGRFLLHVIDRSPKGEAYNLSVKEMAEVNRLSPAQIYRAIKVLEDTKMVMRVKSRLKHCARSLSLALVQTKNGQKCGSA